MDDPSQRIFLIAEGKGSKAHAVGALGLRDINWRSRHAEYWIYLGDRLARGKGLADEASRLLCGLPLAVWGCIASFSRSMSPTSPRLAFTGGLDLSRKAYYALPPLRTAASLTGFCFPCCRTNFLVPINLCLKKTQAPKG